MTAIRVAVAGAAGRMGETVCGAVSGAEDMELTGRADPVLGTSVGDVLGQADVLVDFTLPDTAVTNAREAVSAGVHVVIGTTGFNPTELAGLTGANIFIAPNFAIGAVLMMHFARIAARYFDVAEIIELHHDKKIDAPSGTALATARDMIEARGRPFEHPATEKMPIPGSRGAEDGGVTIHSVRLPGLVAHQEVLLGGLGQILTIRHDSTSRESFIPGVLLAVREVMQRDGLVIGLDRLMGLTV